MKLYYTNIKSIISILLFLTLLQGNLLSQNKKITKPEFEIFPILMYDTDIGFGYGVKTFFLNYLKSSESFDLILFNSSKGERWYKFVFSLPDFEKRQGTAFPLAIDFIADFDKWINYSYFGIGNKSKQEDRINFTKQNLEISTAFSSGFTQDFSAQFILKFNSRKFFDFKSFSKKNSVLTYSILFAAQYDSRDSYINPATGLLFKTEVEFSPIIFDSNTRFNRYAFWSHYYFRILSTSVVFASRLGFQMLDGKDLPIQILLPIGGNRTLRGYVQDRFIDKISSVFNAELRTPVYKRFGLVIGLDAGKVWNRFSQIDFKNWPYNPVLGLRFNMNNFIVRADAGFGRESTGFYFNFGHVF